MTASQLRWGAGLLAFSPLASVFLLVVMKRPELVIICIVGAFAYLVSLLLSAILWVIVPPWQDVASFAIIVGVTCQALLRVLSFQLYHKTESMLKCDGRIPSPLCLHSVNPALSFGVGFGLMHSIMLLGSVLASSADDLGVLYAQSCSQLPFVIVLALIAAAFGILDILLSFLTFLYVKRRRWTGLFLAITAHLGASCTTLSHQAANGCNISLPVLYCFTALMGAVCVREYRDPDAAI